MLEAGLSVKAGKLFSAPGNESLLNNKYDKCYHDYFPLIKEYSPTVSSKNHNNPLQ